MRCTAVVGGCLALVLAAPLSAQTRYGGAFAAIAFGSSLARIDDALLVGRPGELALFPAPASHAGSVHVYTRDAAAGWTEQGTIAPADGEVGDLFGRSLGHSGNVLIAGAPGAAGGRGAAYVFERSPTGQWREVGRLSDPQGGEGDAFGTMVAIAGDVAAVGAPGSRDRTGSVFVFTRSGAAWSAAGRLEADDLAAGDAFGTAVAVDGSRAIVGAPGPGPNMLGQGTIGEGRAYVFARQSDGQWQREARLSVAAGQPAGFGTNVLIRGDEAFVAAPFFNQFTGTVVRYSRDTSGAWIERERIAPPSPQPGAFGFSLALGDTDLLVGAAQEAFTGAVHVFRRAQGESSFRHAQRLAGDRPLGAFGGALATVADEAWIGAPGVDVFEGTAIEFHRDASGQWQSRAAVVTDVASLAPITGATVQCTDAKADVFGCTGVDLLSFLPVDAIGGSRGTIVNDLWGWTDPQTGHEIAIVGRNDGTAFIDVTDASNPVYLGELPMHEGAVANLWRDIKVYNDHAFIVADGAGPHGMQVFDLRQLRNLSSRPARFTETAHYDRVHSAHNIVINEAAGFAFIVGGSMGGETCGGGLHMIDIRNPAAPAFAGCFSDTRTGLARTGYSHDAQCITYNGPDTQYRGREICFGSNESALSIADVTDKAKPVPISTAAYPNVSYLHQGWVTEDHRFLFMDDELDELSGAAPRTRTLVWDIEDLDDPILVKEHLGTTEASDHNLYVKGNYLYESNYVSGLRILDISDPRNPVEVGFFDTVPWGPDKAGFNGSWSNYPFFPSGNIVVTSIREGVFVLKQRPPRPIS
ncbi:MAG: choice-of-anchor B family protein [Longimicrobiales bacterium]